MNLTIECPHCRMKVGLPDSIQADVDAGAEFRDRQKRASSQRKTKSGGKNGGRRATVPNPTTSPESAEDAKGCTERTLVPLEDL